MEYIILKSEIDVDSGLHDVNQVLGLCPMKNVCFGFFSNFIKEVKDQWTEWGIDYEIEESSLSDTILKWHIYEKGHYSDNFVEIDMVKIKE